MFRRYLPDGEVREKWVLSDRGLGLTYWPTHNVLWAEVSLPKALNGRNDVLLDREGEVRAIAVVDAHIAELVPGLPPFGTWSPRRLDAVRQVRVGSRPALTRVLRALRDVDAPRWGLPVVGQAGSCTWGGRGSQRARAYDKWAEVRDKGDGSPVPPEDLLRVESVLRRVRETMKAKRVTLVEAMASGVAERPLERVWPRVVRAVEEVDVRASLALLKLVRRHGMTKAVRLLGYAMVTSQVTGPELEDMLGSRVTMWRWNKELEQAGVDAAAIDWEGVDAGSGLASLRRLTELRHAAEAHQVRRSHGSRESA